MISNIIYLLKNSLIGRGNLSKRGQERVYEALSPKFDGVHKIFLLHTSWVWLISVGLGIIKWWIIAKTKLVRYNDLVRGLGRRQPHLHWSKGKQFRGPLWVGCRPLLWHRLWRRLCRRRLSCGNWLFGKAEARDELGMPQFTQLQGENLWLLLQGNATSGK